MTVDIALAVPLRAGRVLVAQRAAGSRFAGAWEFPGGKIEPGEDPCDAARRELAEETGLAGGETAPLVVVVHAYGEHPLRFHVFVVTEPEGEVRMDGLRSHAWVAIDALAELDMPAANRKVIQALNVWLGTD